VRVKDQYFHGITKICCYEYIEGVRLTQPHELKNAAKDIMQQLLILHSFGFVYGGNPTLNIIMTRQGRYLLTDFSKTYHVSDPRFPPRYLSSFAADLMEIESLIVNKNFFTIETD
jgi:RIO-like serine/threonine protein kinase